MQVSSSTKQQKHILIVDDNEDVRLLLQMILLEEEGKYLLSFAETGPEALTKSVQGLPDLIFMDMSLPQMSGWEVVTQLRRLPAFATTPIIALTAHATLPDQERALAVGCNVHIGKPFDVGAIFAAIERFLPA